MRINKGQSHTHTQLYYLTTPLQHLLQNFSLCHKHLDHVFIFYTSGAVSF